MNGIYEIAEAQNSSLKQKEKHSVTKNFKQPIGNLKNPRRPQSTLEQFENS